MRATGPLIVLLVLFTWVLELILGWALVFAGHGFESSEPLGFDDRLLFSARAIVGRSGNEPSLAVDGDGWELLYALAGMSGVLMVSVGLAYVLPILASVAHKRSIAARIHTLGDTVDDMRALGRTPGGSSFELHLVALVGEISLTAERHRSYPVLHYFHSRDPHAALAPAIAKMVVLLRGPLEEVDKVDLTVRLPLERAVANLLAALSSMGLSRYARVDGRIDHDSLDRIELDPSAGGEDRLDVPSLDWFEAYVRFDGWEWEAVPEGDSSRREPG